ncbi:putative subtilase-type serine protease [bacterium HR08]|nr:putative subtilase-type serine protease [bacterium HR08]
MFRKAALLLSLLFSLQVILPRFSPFEPRAGGPLAVTREGMPFRWNPAQPIPYTLDRGPLGPLTNEQAAALAEQAFQTWASVPTARVRFRNAGFTDVDVTGANAPAFLNQIMRQCQEQRLCLNPVIFDADGSVIEALLGRGSSTRLAAWAAPLAMTGAEILQGVILINGRFATTPDRLRGILTHEVGHFLGLDHAQLNTEAAFDADPENDRAVPTMFPFFGSHFRAEEWATLHLDDQAAISSLYPAPDFDLTTGTIRGRILYADGAGFMGANVIARKVDDPQLTAISTVSGYRHIGTIPKTDKPFRLGYVGADDPDLLGYYEIRGLPPGTYTVEIEPIDPRFTEAGRVGPLDPPAPLPAPREFYSGPGESDRDDPNDRALITIFPGLIVEDVNIILNTTVTRPPNDECASATPISASSFTDRVNIWMATSAATDPPQSCTLGRRNSQSVWYRFTPPSDGAITLSTLGSGYDTAIAVYTGSCTTLQELACNDDWGLLPASQLTMSVRAGTTYLIEITSAGGPVPRPQEATLVFTFRFSSTGAPFDAAPTSLLETMSDETFTEMEPNNTLATANLITPDVTVIGTLTPTGDVDVFAFEGSAGQQVTIDVDAQSLTPKSPADTVVTLYDGNGRPLAENDDESVDTRDSLLRFTLPAAGRYAFQIRDAAGRGGPSFAYRARVTLTGGAPPGRIIESEPNNSLAQANAITPNATIRGTLDPTGDVDFFSFQAAAGQRVRVDIAAKRLTPPSAADTVVALFDSSGRKLAENDDRASGQLDSLLEFTLPAPGRYFFSVRDFGNKGGPAFTYEATVTLTGGAPTRLNESEPNNTFAQAQTITPDVILVGRLDPAGDVDIFAFTASAGQRLTVDINARTLTPPSEADTVVTLFDNNGAQLAENDDAGSSLDSLLTFDIPRTGRYFVRIRNFSPKGGPTYTYEAILTLTGAASPPGMVTESEPNNSFAQANAITPNVTVSGTINPAGDVDIFAFEARRGQQLLIEVDARSLTPPSPLDTVVTLFDSRGQQLAENDDADGSTDSRLRFTIPADGRYFFRVRSFEGKGGPDYVYRATVTLTDAARPQESEPNDHFAQANRLVPETPIIGTINPAGDADFFFFESERGRTVTITVRARTLTPPSPAMLKLELFFGTVKLEESVASDTRDPALIFMTLPLFGRYFVRLTDTQGRGGPTFTYELTLTIR